MNVNLVLAVLILIAIVIVIQEAFIKSDEKEEKEEIKYILIPRLTRTVICVDCINGNFHSNVGDIIETSCEVDGKHRYYVRSYGGFYKLTLKQIKRLERDYNIRIIM